MQRQKKKRCVICKNIFNPIHRLGFRQITCGGSPCRKERKKRYDSGWHRKNRDLHNQMILDWFLAHPTYLRNYMRRKRRKRVC